MNIAINAKFILTKDEILWCPEYYYHSDILKHYRIDDSSVFPNFVKIEMTNELSQYTDYEKYHIYTYQKTLPSWFNYNELKTRCYKEIKQWIKYKFIYNGNHTFSGSANKYILGGNVIINDLEDRSEIWIYGKSKVEINNMKCCNVCFNENSTGKINNQSGGYVRFCDNSTGELINHSGGDVGFLKNSSGIVNNHSGGYFIFYGNSTGEINNQSGGSVYFYDNSIGTINNQFGGNILFRENSSGKINNQSGGNVGFFDNSIKL